MGLFVQASLTAADALLPLYENDAHREDGCRDFTTWLEVRYRLGRSEALTLTRRLELFIAARAQGVPLEDGITATGLLGLGDADAAARYGAGPATVLENAGRAATPTDFARLLRRERDQRTADAAAAAAGNGEDCAAALLEAQREAAWQGRRCTVRRGDDGTSTLVAHGPSHEIDVLATELERLAKRAWDALPATETKPSLSARLFDALIGLATSGAGLAPDAALTNVTIHTTPDLLRAWDDHGCPVAPSLFFSVLDTARLRLAVEDEAGNPYWISDARCATGTKRKHLKERDGQTCSVPGCSVTWGLEVHHIHEHANRGRLTGPNLVLLCQWHHRQQQRGELVIEGVAPDGVSYHRPDGTRITRIVDSGWLAPPWIEANRLAQERRAAYEQWRLDQLALEAERTRRSRERRIERAIRYRIESDDGTLLLVV